MKKGAFKLFLASLLFISGTTFGQNLDDLLNKATSLSSSGNGKQLAEVLGQAGKALSSEVNGADADIKSKILGQAAGLKDLIPAALSGKADLKSIGGIIGKIKLLLAANRLKSALSGGKSGLAANSGKITDALNLMKGSTAALGESSQKGFDKLIGSALKKTSKLDKGWFKGLKAAAAEKQLNKLVSMTTSLL